MHEPEVIFTSSTYQKGADLVLLGHSNKALLHRHLGGLELERRLYLPTLRFVVHDTRQAA